jgi:three-Cys-motif partner protein
MIEHVFGGDWTEEKLRRLHEYLAAYRAIFSGSQKASFFKTWYVDAFAGTGTRSSGQPQHLPLDPDEAQSDADASRYRDGSAKIALGLDSPFDRYLFIEKSKARAEELKTMIAEKYPSLMSRCEIRQTDANAALSSWCKARNWKKERAVVFLDPYGMQVEWNTVDVLGATKAVDLWYLFPLGVARMLTKDGVIEKSWQDRLDILFGTGNWREYFYKTTTERGLFGDFDRVTRDATVRNILDYIEGRLKTSFTAVAPSLVLKNSKSSPLFALCFAVGNQRGAPIAIRIAKSILKDD